MHKINEAKGEGTSRARWAHQAHGARHALSLCLLPPPEPPSCRKLATLNLFELLLLVSAWCPALLDPSPCC